MVIFRFINDLINVILEITSFGSRLESEIKSFGGRVESTIKALQAENKALKEENSNLQEMIEGKDQSKLSILKCAICMEFKKLDTFIINSPCGHCFCEMVRYFYKFLSYLSIILKFSVLGESPR